MKPGTRLGERGSKHLAGDGFAEGPVAELDHRAAPTSGDPGDIEFGQRGHHDVVHVERDRGRPVAAG